MTTDPHANYPLRDVGPIASPTFGPITSPAFGPAPGPPPSAPSTPAPPAPDDWREHVARWYYDASPVLLGGLSDMYVIDPNLAQELP